MPFFAMTEGQDGIPVPVLESRDGEVWLFDTREQAEAEATQRYRVGQKRIAVYEWPTE